MPGSRSFTHATRLSNTSHPPIPKGWAQTQDKLGAYKLGAVLTLHLVCPVLRHAPADPSPPAAMMAPLERWEWPQQKGCCGLGARLYFPVA